jgi:hypothetical protein
MNKTLNEQLKASNSYGECDGPKQPEVSYAYQANDLVYEAERKNRRQKTLDMLMGYVQRAATAGEKNVKIFVEKKNEGYGIFLKVSPEKKSVDNHADNLGSDRQWFLHRLVDCGFQGTIFLHDTRVEVNIYW